MSLLEASLAAGRNGQKGITTADAMYVEKTLEDGNDELAAWYLALAEERAERKIQENQERMSAINADNNMRAAQAAEQTRMQYEQILSQLKTTEDGQKIANQLEADLLKITAKKNADYELMTLEGQLQSSQGKEISGKIRI
jgi:acetyl-CoA acetyltransferase